MAITDTDELVAVAEGILGQRVTWEGFLGKGGVGVGGGGGGMTRSSNSGGGGGGGGRRRRWGGGGGGGGEVVLVVSGEKGNLGRPERGGPPAVVT